MNTSATDLIQQLEGLMSEGRNPATISLDQMTTAELVSVINKEDRKVAAAVDLASEEISAAVDLIVAAFQKGGRLIYIGAGTSGRLGVLDAVECPPTFSVDKTHVIGLIAGGEHAVLNAVEGAEDNQELGKQDLINASLSSNDIVVGIAASGRTPYVIGGLNYANELGCNTVSVVCNRNSPLTKIAKIGICVEVGPECLTGSTRMKAGTAQKLVLNTLSTAAFVKMGKVYENLMVDVSTSNAKLRARAQRIVMQATACTQQQAESTLKLANNSVKEAILMLLLDIDAAKANSKLKLSSGYLRQALDQSA
ncbi:N-acetylmuramic acid 6-phosphate etherase [Paraglaciecola arctica]|uniref:N-acetylmuramic acid 6-phosphate etherase n=1 Tax=Paraglaciecola arctica BSs20135 TaxID=493475 RepID=K6XFQ2_9ALTE|nr:N-acetylmuramic acid 6-phosphate etherase [Paraglaciecola arctica]GAC19469.1 N-acetylmuramic acid 6-phosphate etherase [Paraglaciecola arctica BSs20135]